LVNTGRKGKPGSRQKTDEISPQRRPGAPQRGHTQEKSLKGPRTGTALENRKPRGRRKATPQQTRNIRCVDREKDALSLVDAFDAKDSVDAADIGNDRFELALVLNFEAGFDARVLAVRAALQGADI
jgi:hypothetical protein